MNSVEAPARPGRVFHFLALAAQMGLLVLVVRAFSVENAAFFRVLSLAAAGFVVHALLPLRLRLPFFVLLSLVGIGLMFGVVPGLWLVGLGMALIGLAHAPLAWGLRLLLLLAAGAALAAYRALWWTPPWSSVIWPIFGAMFMFRLIVYLYDLRNRTAPFGLWRAMAYFFMLPNLCFPLFPVVDYKTFVRGHFRSDAFELYQTGMDWMLRGLIQLLLYRLVYQYLSVDPSAIDSAGGAALYLVRPYLLYLRISGSFHVVAGMLHLFGFQLPRTNHNYFLARSFTDYWRRINIYWKDFIQKIFFNPMFFRLNRRMSTTPALILATLVAFLATWALHSYQWFWIRGSFPIIWQDIVFWSVMGLVVLANMIWEAKKGRRRSLTQAARSWRDDLKVIGQTLGTFAVICTSWAVWSVPSFDELGLMLGKLKLMSPVDAAWILAAIVGLAAAAVIYDRLESRERGSVLQRRQIPRFLGIPLVSFRTGGAAFALVALAYAGLLVVYPPRLAEVVDGLRNPLRLSRQEAAMLDRGYYEDLTDVNRFNEQLADIYAQKPPDWDRCWAIHRTGGFPTHELLPSRRVAFKGAMMSTNRWGMRDREYEKAKPADVYRIAIIGASHTMGTGVEDDESFENLVEDRLNEERRTPQGKRLEILNYSVGGYGPIARLAVLESQILDFQPDALIVVGINDLHWMTKEIIQHGVDGMEMPYPEFAEVAREAGLHEGMSLVVAEDHMRPFREKTLAVLYGNMAQICREHGILPCAAFIPRGREEDDKTLAEMRRQVEIAHEQGLVVLDMLDSYDPAAADLSPIWLAPWDRHPNAQGHRMLAEAFYRELTAALGLGAATSAAPSEPSTDTLREDVDG